MIPLKYFLFYSFLSTGFIACSQSKYSIKNIYAVYKVHLPGNIAINENGNEIPSRDTVNLIFIESHGKDMHWSNAWKNGKSFSILPTLIDSGTYNIGTKKMTNENMIIHSSSGNKLWQLQLIATDQTIPQPEKLSRDEILLEGIYQRKTILQKVKTQIELNSIPSQ